MTLRPCWIDTAKAEDSTLPGGRQVFINDVAAKATMSKLVEAFRLLAPHAQMSGGHETSPLRIVTTIEQTDSWSCWAMMVFVGTIVLTVPIGSTQSEMSEAFDGQNATRLLRKVPVLITIKQMLANHQAWGTKLEDTNSLFAGPDIFSKIRIKRPTPVESSRPVEWPSLAKVAVSQETNAKKRDERTIEQPLPKVASKRPPSAVKPSKYSYGTKGEQLAHVKDTGNEEASDEDQDAWISQGNIHFDAEDEATAGISSSTHFFLAYMPAIEHIPPNQRVEEGLHLIIQLLHEMDKNSEVHPIDTKSSALILQRGDNLSRGIDGAKYFAPSNPRSLKPVTGTDGEGRPWNQPNIFLTLQILMTGKATMTAGKMNMILSKTTNQIYFDRKKVQAISTMMNIVLLRVHPKLCPLGILELLNAILRVYCKQEIKQTEDATLSESTEINVRSQIVRAHHLKNNTILKKLHQKYKDCNKAFHIEVAVEDMERVKKLLKCALKHGHFSEAFGSTSTLLFTGWHANSGAVSQNEDARKIRMHRIFVYHMDVIKIEGLKELLSVFNASRPYPPPMRGREMAKK